MNRLSKNIFLYTQSHTAKILLLWWQLQQKQHLKILYSQAETVQGLGSESQAVIRQLI